MKTVKHSIAFLAIIFMACLVFGIPAMAEDIEKTIKYKAPTMQQTTDFIEKKTLRTFGFDEGQCMAIIKYIEGPDNFTYYIPLQKINPSPDYVEPSLDCVSLTVDGYEKEIKRVEGDGNVEMKSKVDICTPDRESADKVARAVRYLIGLCGGPPCVDCDPFQWQ